MDTNLLTHILERKVLDSFIISHLLIGLTLNQIFFIHERNCRVTSLFQFTDSFNSDLQDFVCER